MATSSFLPSVIWFVSIVVMLVIIRTLASRARRKRNPIKVATVPAIAPSTEQPKREWIPYDEWMAFYNSAEWLDLRYRMLKTYGARCMVCGESGKHAVIQVDHIKPRSKFPELALDPNNLQVLCRRCNLGKSNKDATDWR